MKKHSSFGFFFAMEPKPKARPRAVRCGRFIRIYQPKSNFEKALTVFAATRKNAPRRIECAVGVDMIFRFRRPGSIPKAQIFKHSRGDADNYAKGALDSLTEAGYWRDDSLVVSLSVEKIYNRDDEKEGVFIAIRHVECKKKAKKSS